MGGTAVLEASAVVTGGDGLARAGDGRVVLVQGALPGETVRALVTEVHRSYARARLVEVVHPSPARAVPPCPHVARGCGGCGWQHVSPPAQARLKARVVEDNLRRLGQVASPVVNVGPSVGPWAYRTTLRLAVRHGRAGFRRSASHEVVSVGSCLVAHPLLEELLGCFFGRAEEVTLRCGARTGERLALLAPRARGAQLPGDVVVVGADELGRGRQAWSYEEICGRRLRFSARSFAQASAEGAELLVDVVSQALQGAPSGPMVDAYGGVGLFAATLGGDRPVVVVEASASAVADAAVNLSGRPGALVVHADVGRWPATPAAVVVADPPRSGLGRLGAAVLAATGATHLALVSCDPASLARDAGLLAGHGFTLEWSTVVDLFPGTPHVEVVSRLVR